MRKLTGFVAAWLMLWAATASGAGAAPAAKKADSPAADAPATVVSMNDYWRYFISVGQPVMGTATQPEADPPDKRSGIRLWSAPPPADWAAPDFDDSRWGRDMGPFFAGQGLSSYNLYEGNVSHLGLRAPFVVEDVSKVAALTLACSYRGGIVVYLNGHEIVRGHLPAGDLTVDTLADDYPPEASLRPDGAWIRWGFGDPQKNADRLTLRIRRLGPIDVPAKFLRKGENVLAVGLHRSALAKELRAAPQFWEGRWNTLGCNRLELRAAGGGIAPSVGRPAGVRLWNANALLAVGQKDYAPPGATLRPIRIVGTRNGSFGGKVIVSAEGPVQGLRATAGAFKRTDGAGEIPASALRVRYAVEEKAGDALGAAPPADAAVVGVWLFVDVPADAAPGRYEGTLSVEAAGLARTDVPVSLSVAGWTLPEPKTWRTWVDFIESPESVALAYDAPLWSDAHFARLAEVFRLLARVGNRTAYVPLIAQTNLGNAETMVRWVRQADGAYRFDFTPMERYLDTVEANAGRPIVVVLQVWDVHLPGSWKDRRAPLRVTRLDPATSKTETIELPDYTTPEGAPLWKPLAEELVARMKKRGLDGALMLGLTCDGKPIQGVIDYWKDTLPGLPWVAQGHGLTSRLYDVPVGYSTTVWNARMAWDPDTLRYHGWRQDKEIVAQFDRDMWKPDYAIQLVASRVIGERNITGQQRGFGRMSADFWPVLKGGRGSRSLSARYPKSSWSQCNLYQTPFLGFAPGEPPQSTVRFEMIREGVQECEARIFIERALLDEELRARLGEELGGRLQQTLDDRTRMLIDLNSLRQNVGCMLYVCSDWQAASARLYAAAAETEAKLKQP